MSLEQNSHSSESNTLASESAGRRSFLGYVIGLIISGISLVLGVTIGRYSIAPALSPADASEWAEVGLVEDIPEEKPVKRNVVVSRTAGWARFNSQQLVWVIKKGDSITAFSAICPHLGCTINEAAKGFICPCHGSAWDGLGERLAGPTPRGMDTLETRVEGDLLKVKYQYFRQGVPQKEEVR
ncbi:MAG TPA: ubiquinol-cytochrome c reductase iron-sulfur subunit [Blastocatellia bacterium]|nr:ubiquinol-cytochrome c reductase iron-sulfur subunit [Blastocatellia bacterium]